MAPSIHHYLVARNIDGTSVWANSGEWVCSIKSALFIECCWVLTRAICLKWNEMARDWCSYSYCLAVFASFEVQSHFSITRNSLSCLKAEIEKRMPALRAVMRVGKKENRKESLSIISCGNTVLVSSRVLSFLRLSVVCVFFLTKLDQERYVFYNMKSHPLFFRAVDTKQRLQAEIC